MPTIAYEHKNFRPATIDIIDQARAICTDYANKGYSLTLRQLYYRFVAAAIIPNTERSYKNLGSIINDARLAGALDWNHLTDRTRNPNERGAGWDSPRDLMEAAARSFIVDVWENQPYHIEVWVEKEALIDVADVACADDRVTTLACRGYMSQSEQWASAMRMLRKIRDGKQVHVFHLGDHDPSGIDMSRDNGERLGNFITHHLGYDVVLSRDFTFERIALTMDQIDQYAPPPNPAKVTDARFAGYEAIYGDESWELDSMPPDVLDTLIRANVADYIDHDQRVEDLAREQRLIDQAVQLIVDHGHELS